MGDLVPNKGTVPDVLLVQDCSPGLSYAVYNVPCHDPLTDVSCQGFHHTSYTGHMHLVEMTREDGEGALLLQVRSTRGTNHHFSFSPDGACFLETLRGSGICATT